MKGKIYSCMLLGSYRGILFVQDKVKNIVIEYKIEIEILSKIVARCRADQMYNSMVIAI